MCYRFELLLNREGINLKPMPAGVVHFSINVFIIRYQSISSIICFSISIHVISNNYLYDAKRWTSHWYLLNPVGYCCWLLFRFICKFYLRPIMWGFAARLSKPNFTMQFLLAKYCSSLNLIKVPTINSDIDNIPLRLLTLAAARRYFWR